MRKNRTRMCSRAFRRPSSRKLTPQDLKVLDFLWTWKAASTPLLKELVWKKESFWWAYKALKQLQREKYIQLLPRGKNLELELWALTRTGFEVVLMDRDDIEQYRFRVHAPAHDYLATCLQLGDLWKSGVDVDFFTEQQLSALSKWNFPKAVFFQDGHIPDGITYIRGAQSTAIVGYEVDLNLKDEERYYRTVRYYANGLKPNLLVWLVRNTWIAEKILSQIESHGYLSQGSHLSKRTVFVLLEDFKKNVWGARGINRPLLGVSLRKVHENLLQSTGKGAPNFGQTAMRNIFFPNVLSPQKLTELFDLKETPKTINTLRVKGVN